MKVTFDPPHWILKRDGVVFHARIGAERELVICVIENRTLRDYYGAEGKGEGDYIAAFMAHRTEIEAIATSFIESSMYEDGGVIIRSKDVEEYRSERWVAKRDRRSPRPE